MENFEGLVPLHNENRNCLEDVSVTVCGWFQRRYEYMYKNSWSFYYDTLDVNKCIGERLFYNDQKQLSLFTEHSGIKIDYCQFNELEEGVLKLRQALEENVIVALTNMDMFWLPWTSSYRKNHGGHTFIIKGYNESLKSFTCMDPYFQQDNLILSLRNLQRSTNGRYLVYSVAYDEKTEFNINSTINNTVTKLFKEQDGQNAFNCMRKFADDVERSFDLKNEMKGYEEWFLIPLYNNLQTIGRRRMQFSELLHFFSSQVKEKEELEELSNNLYQMGKMWNRLKLQFGKECIIGNVAWVRRNVAEKVRNIVDVEEACASKITYMKFMR